MPESEATSETAALPAARKPRFSPLRLVPLVVIAAGLAALFSLGIDDYLTFEALRENRGRIMDWTGQNYALVVLGFIGAYFVAVTFSLPGAVWITLAGGFVFGTLATTIYVVVAATLGATAIFLAARYAIGDFIHAKLHAKMGPAMRRMEAGFHENEFNYLLVLRLVPLFPFWLVNLVPAFLGVKTRTYVLGTFIGIVPGTFVYASVGSGLGSVFEAGMTLEPGIVLKPEVLLPIIGLAALSLVPVLYKTIQKRKRAG